MKTIRASHIFASLPDLAHLARTDAGAFTELVGRFEDDLVQIVGGSRPVDGDVDAAVDRLRAHLHHVILKMPGDCESVRGYILTSLRRYHSRSRERRHGEPIPITMKDPGALPDEVLLQGEKTRRVKTATSDLPPVMQRIIRLRYEDGLTQAVVAKRLGVTERTVQRREAAALRRLRSTLKED